MYQPRRASVCIAVLTALSCAAACVDGADSANSDDGGPTLTVHSVTRRPDFYRSSKIVITAMLRNDAAVPIEAAYTRFRLQNGSSLDRQMGPSWNNRCTVDAVLEPGDEIECTLTTTTTGLEDVNSLADATLRFEYFSPVGVQAVEAPLVPETEYQSTCPAHTSSIDPTADGPQIQGAVLSPTPWLEGDTELLLGFSVVGFPLFFDIDRDVTGATFSVWPDDLSSSYQVLLFDGDGAVATEAGARHAVLVFDTESRPTPIAFQMTTDQGVSAVVCVEIW